MYVCAAVLFLRRRAVARAQAQTAETRDRSGDFQIFSLTLSQLSYRGLWEDLQSQAFKSFPAELSRLVGKAAEPSLTEPLQTEIA